jgi:TRAP-type C4-dicarboxylate transport system permease small subunit
MIATVSNSLTRRNAKHVVDNFEGYASAVILFSYLFIIVYGIVTRQLGKAPVWGQDVVIGLFVWLAWLSTAYAVRTNSHLRFTLLFQKLSSRGVYIVYAVEWILWLVFAGIIFRFSIDPTLGAVEAGTTVVGLPLPVWLFRLSIPVGFALILIRVAQQAVLKTQAYRAGEDLRTDLGIGE